MKDRVALFDREALDALAVHLDQHDIAAGEPLRRVELIGNGHSNLTAMIERGDRRLVLRRPPLPPYPAKAHDVLREARILRALEGSAAPVPTVVLVCGGEGVFDAPFYVMEHIDGVVVTTTLPSALQGEERKIGEHLVDTLIELHAIDYAAAGLSELARPDDYLGRQLRTFTRIWHDVRTRSLPRVDQLAGWLADRIPEQAATCIVHGDYRLGNMMLARRPPTRILAIMDWEMATLGDPLADLGYLVATYCDASEPPNVMSELSAVTRAPGFPGRDELVARYAAVTGREVGRLRWYEVLALWKSCIFLESSYRRWQEGRADDPWFATLGVRIPELAEAAWERTQAL